MDRWLERHYQSVVIAIAAFVFLTGILSPPSLMDDVDAVHGAIARAMLRSGDWVTARLNGVVYLDKSPMTYWLIATSYAVFGIHDWAARLPIALSAILLCWIAARFGAWAFTRKAGFYAGLALATCAGLFLFTRILIPEVLLTLAVTVALWAFLRLLDEEETRPRLWAFLLGAALGAGLLLKGLLGVIAPAGAALLYLLATRQLFSVQVWRRLRPFSCLGVALLVAAPWYVLATLANPPYFDFTLRSEPGQFRGFFWRYFINEHLLRYLGLRHPRDYSTVPLLSFWLLHLVWLFPWSAYFPAAARLSYRPTDRAGRTRLLALCWCGFLLLFFAFSTTQEYYTMPLYPALALLAGSAMAEGGKWVRRGTQAASAIAAVAAVVALGIFFRVRSLPAEGDIASALSQNPEAYTLALGHLSDLTLGAFAYLRLPLLVAGIALAIGAAGAWKFADVRGWPRSSAAGGALQGRTKYEERGWLALALMMALLTQAARTALVVFDPYLSSRPLAEALRAAPPGQMIVDGAYYPFSSVFFYADRGGLLLNGRFNNLEYGSYAPGAPAVFIDDATLQTLWRSPARCYLLTAEPDLGRLVERVGRQALYVVKQSGGKALFSNQPLPRSSDK